MIQTHLNQMRFYAVSVWFCDIVSEKMLIGCVSDEQTIMWILDQDSLSKQQVRCVSEE